MEEGDALDETVTEQRTAAAAKEKEVLFLFIQITFFPTQYYCSSTVRELLCGTLLITALCS
jgi:hypothetical protein